MAVADGLGADVLGAQGRVQGELGADVGEGDARVGDVDAAQARLDDRVREADDEGVDLVLLESDLVRGEGLVEGRQVPLPHGLGQVQVRGEGGAVVGLIEERALGHLAHEQRDDDHELLHRAPEARDARLLRRLAQVDLSFSRVAVLELQRADAPR